MTPAQQPDETERYADQLYAARAALAETERPSRHLGVAEIVRFLSDTGRKLSMEEQRALFADPKLRADFRRLKSQFSVADLPALAAASSGDVSTRRFDGGTVSIHASRVPGQVYVVMRFDGPSGHPRAVLLENNVGGLVKRSLPPADANGEVMIVLDEKNTPDEDFLRLISDPTSTGCFLL